MLHRIAVEIALAAMVLSHPPAVTRVRGFTTRNTMEAAPVDAEKLVPALTLPAALEAVMAATPMSTTLAMCLSLMVASTTHMAMVTSRTVDTDAPQTTVAGAQGTCSVAVEARVRTLMTRC